ncbi:MAG: Zn-dependent hydrolase, partial [Bacteroidetes bacterium]|nr:Zn-dependent hydrolase [Bacteroidota bacterium]
MAKKMITILAVFGSMLFMISSCHNQSEKNTATLSSEDSLMKLKTAEFFTVKLTTDLTKLTDKEKQMIPLLIDAAKIMDDLYWEQVIGDKQKFLDSIPDALVKKFALINYGPWERLNGNKSFVKGFGEKPAGANMYPTDMTKEEFEKWTNKDKTSQYSIIGRNEDRSLKNIWYHEA